MFLRNFFKYSTTRNQYFSAIIVNLITLSHSCALGWLSPFLPYLKSDESHLATGPVTSEDISWIGSLICVGGLVGTISFGKITDLVGKKNAMFMLVLPHLSFWCLIFFSTHVYHLYLARFLAGITGGGCLRTVSLYIAEISEDRIRGMLGSFQPLAMSIGILLIFTIGTYVNFFVAPLICFILPTVFTISLLFLPDTPTSLISRNRHNEALESLKFYRTCGNDKLSNESINLEFFQLKKALENKNEEKLLFSDFWEKNARNGMLIGTFLVFLTQFTGVFVLITYTADVFKSSGSSLSPNESSTIVAFIQFIGIYGFTVSVDRFGRKILLTISCTGMSIFLFVLATYCYLNVHGFNLTQFSWIPVISLSLAIFLASIGISSLPFIMIAELMPNKVRNAACTICMSVLSFLAFAVLKIYPALVEAIYLHGCVWIFSATSMLGLFVTILFIPETKGKSLIDN